MQEILVGLSCKHCNIDLTGEKSPALVMAILFLSSGIHTSETDVAHLLLLQTITNKIFFFLPVNKQFRGVYIPKFFSYFRNEYIGIRTKLLLVVHTVFMCIFGFSEATKFLVTVFPEISGVLAGLLFCI